MLGNQGGLFIGALKEEDKKFVTEVLREAHKAGYEYFIEPCAGALAMSYAAIDAGWEPDKIEASDVSYFSGAFARGVCGLTTEDMEIKAQGFSREELLDPATALYAQVYLRMSRKSGTEYFYELLRDLEERRDEHIAKIQEQIDNMRVRLKGMTYKDMDMMKHIAEWVNNDKAVIVACPPTYTGGYEKFFDTGGLLSWREPDYDLFDVNEGMRQLFEMIDDAKALVLVYEETAVGDYVGQPVFGREAGRSGMHMYITSNRPDEVEKLVGGKGIASKNHLETKPLKCGILPTDYKVTEKSDIQVIPIKPENVRYYRLLWTHNFTGTGGASGYAMMLDGYIAGVFGYNTMAMSLGGKNNIELAYGICAPNEQRLNRLLYMVAQKKEILRQGLSDVDKEIVNGVQTTIITKYPESKEMRGLFKMYDRVKAPPLGYKLRYISETRDGSLESILKEWCRKEDKWRKNRNKS